MKILFIFVLFAACATTNQERIFWVGNKICFQNSDKTICTVANDPDDPIHLVSGVEREVEEPKRAVKNWNWLRK